MPLSSVVVNSQNEYQNRPAGVENRFLFIGVSSVLGLQIFDSQTKLDDVFKEDLNSQSYKQLAAAQANAGMGFVVGYVGIANQSEWIPALRAAAAEQQYEALVLCDPLSDTAQIIELSTEIALMQSDLAHYMFAMFQPPALAQAEKKGKSGAVSQTWAEYVESTATLISSVESERLMCVPPVVENALGILAGRLGSRAVTIADPPIRYKSGPLVGVGAAAIDSTGAAADNGIFTQLDAIRCTVPQFYHDKTMRWADGLTLDNAAGDYKFIEYLRPVLHACRLIYAAALPMIGDRQFNNTPAGIAHMTSKFYSVLMPMTKSVAIGATKFPGIIRELEPSAVVIEFFDETSVRIYTSVRPYGSPKTINASVSIDLQTEY